MVNPLDPYEQILLTGYTEEEILEIEALMLDGDQSTYDTLAHRVVDHAERHGFSGNYLRYLRKAKNFNKKGAKRKVLSDGAIRWNKGFEFLIERAGKIIPYREN